MPSIIVLSVAGIAAAYVFLRALASLTHDPREPKQIIGKIPFISPLIGMLYEKGRYYIRMRDEHGLPIYTLRVPGPPLYVVNSLSMIQRIDRHISTVAFSPIQARACDKAMAVSKDGMDKIAGEKKLTEDGYLRSFPRASAPAVSPGRGLDALNREAVSKFAATFDRLAAQGCATVKLFAWVQHEIFAATTHAMYGPHNPFRHGGNEKAWFEYEAGILTMLMDFMPSIFARRSLQARDVMVAEFERYFQESRHEDGSLFVQLRQKHNLAFGLSISDTAHTEVGQVAAGIINTAPTAFWAAWQILADPVVYEDCRSEVAQLVQTDPDGVCTIDLAQVRTACPILVSTWQEVLRFHGISIAARIIQEDTLVDNKYFLKKGGVVLMPNAVIHSDQSLWGPTAGEFNHKRFLKAKKDGSTRHPAAAFRGFGGGHVLCPGRHFASTEILSLLALLLVRFDVRPVGGKWVEPGKNMVMDRACPLPKDDVEVELTPKSDQKWRIIFSDSDQGINIVAEDLDDGES
ncbi:cytochrome P450 [Camillea tinctor]|nr:cytochrome P450 [Camillea tinctor]